MPQGDEEGTQGQRKRRCSVLEQISTLQPVEDHMPQQVFISWRNCGSWIVHARAGSPDKNYSPYRTHAGQGLSWRTAAHGELMLEQRKAGGWRSNRVEMLHTDCSPPFPISPALLRAGGKVEELGMQEWSWVWGKKWGLWGRRFCFSLPKYILIGNKSSQVCFDCDGKLLSHLPVFISIHKHFFILFSPPPCQIVRLRERLGGQPAASPGQRITCR